MNRNEIMNKDLLCECGDTVYARGLCRTHYNKAYWVTHPVKQKLEVHRKFHRTLKGQYAGLKNNAKKRGYEVALTFEEFAEVRSSLLCHYCGHELPATGGGLDRKNNSRGYLKDNVVPCCDGCNRIKGKYLSYFEMLVIMSMRRQDEMGMIGGC